MTLSKKILLGSFAAAMAFSGASFASAPGWYVGAQGGWTNTNPNLTDLNGGGITMTSGSTSGTGGAWGVRAGYQFDQNWAAEAGYTSFAKTSYNNLAGTFNGSAFTGGASYNQNVWDIVGKGMYGFDNGFGVYAKAGVAFVRQSASANLTNGSANASASATGNATRPVAGLGVKYDFNQNVSVDLSATRIFTGGNLQNPSDAYMVGVAYNFG